MAAADWSMEVMKMKMRFGAGAAPTMSGTPASCPSTAPSTPLCFRLPEPFASPTGWKFVRSASGTSTQVPEELEELDLDDDTYLQMSTDLSVSPPDNHMGPVVSAGLPPLTSDLGLWAQAVVKAEAWFEEQRQSEQHDEDAPQERRPSAKVVKPAMPPLVSELGRYAQAAVETEDVQNFVLDNRRFQAETLGLAYRRSKQLHDRDHNVIGPVWGSVVSGVDQGDGWLKVGAHYLPMMLGGLRVLTPREEVLTEQSFDGPALTWDGRAVDLDGGVAIFFSHGRELSASHQAKCEMKEAARMLSAAQVAHALCEADARVATLDACSIDAAGVVHGFAPIAAGGPGKERLKVIHRKHQLRRRPTNTDEHQQPDPPLCVDSNGLVSLFLGLASMFDEKTRLYRKRIVWDRVHEKVPSHAEGPAVIMDAFGTIQGFKDVDTRDTAPQVATTPEDGPALTSHGRAVDLRAGSRLFFTHAKESSLGHTLKCKLKEDFRLLRAAQVAHSACEREAAAFDAQSGVVFIDMAGIARAANGAALPGLGRDLRSSTASRLKRFHQKRALRWDTSVRRAMVVDGSTSTDEHKQLDPLPCVDSNGLVSLFLGLASIFDEKMRLYRKQIVWDRVHGKEPNHAEGPAVIIDALGTIQGFKDVDTRDAAQQVATTPEDGPALTSHGRAVDLRAGSRLFFTHDRESSLGHTLKCKLKEDSRLLRAAQVAHSACEREAAAVDAQSGVVFVDMAGIARAANGAALPGLGRDLRSNTASRLKRFHQKRALRRDISVRQAMVVDGVGVIHDDNIV